MSESGSNADHPQLHLFGGDTQSRLIKTTPKANKRAAKAPAQRYHLPLIDNRYQPRAGVPKTRGECPDTSEEHCPWIRCRFHLFTEEVRAGRPGLSEVERDARGLVISQPGALGDERAPPTVNPRWLRLKDEPAEAERCCPAWLWFDDNGQPEINVDEGRWSHMRVKAGDALDIVDRISSTRVTWAKVGNDNESVEFDEMPPRYETMFVWIVRKRLVQSCALDVVEKLGKQSNEDTGFHLARHRTLAARINRSALRNGCRKAQEMGVDPHDFVEALMRMGEK